MKRLCDTNIFYSYYNVKSDFNDSILHSDEEDIFDNSDYESNGECKNVEK